jgi:hypothetical protein
VIDVLVASPEPMPAVRAGEEPRIPRFEPVLQAESRQVIDLDVPRLKAILVVFTNPAPFADEWIVDRFRVDVSMAEESAFPVAHERLLEKKLE